ncbi:MAG: ATP-dependent Clp protease ATP-binding subunit [Bacteroidales bacterium]|nr:ATP-dependent Clp protease ATP-binding subunit [Bacteroidales bacterium]MDD7574835.1 ATP-dependent Clp protease ATP-binding subunit [Bacteroidales bacterium]MDY5788651.1 ATP-dependent Clp protease ATP-binding subunit [Candidatus Onthomorpha sp.]
MDFKLSANAEEILKNSRGEAVRLNSERIETGHIILAILRQKQCKAYNFLTENCDCDKLKTLLEERLKGTAGDDVVVRYDDDMLLGDEAAKLIKMSNLETLIFHSGEVGSLDLLSSILHDRQSSVFELFNSLGVDYQLLEKYRRKNSSAPNFKIQIFAKDEDNDEISRIEFNAQSFETYENPGKEAETPMLDNFGKNLSSLAEQGLLDPVVGREKEIQRICKILSRRKKNNPILIGEPGVGKSSIAEGLAIRIAEKNIPYSLMDKTIYTLDLALVVAGTKYRGQFEERIKGLIAELEKNENIIVFIDEIHTIAGAGNSEGGLDASNIFKPALARGEIQCIGATTIEEYRKYIEADGALERRFQKVLVEPTSKEDTLEILRNIKGKYEEFHNVVYSEEALKACVEMTERYMPERNLPDKAIDVLDEAGAGKSISSCQISQTYKDIQKSLTEAKKERQAYATEQKFEQALQLKNKIEALQHRLEEERELMSKHLSDNPQNVSEKDVAAVVSSASGISVEKIEQDEKQKLLDMQSVLSHQIIGQNEAVEKVCQAIKRTRTGLKDPERPSGSFIFIGSTGVGKTLLAKRMAEYLFGSRDSLIRFDMSEFMEKHSVSKLIGAPPGYVGYEQAGQLTEKVRTHPYSIILFDEIEKAHSDVFNLLLQILDEGRLSDASGRKVDFRNTIIIMTSNVGTRRLSEFGVGVGFSTSSIKENTAAMEQNLIERDLKKTFAPEFLNRIDEIVYFNPLGKEELIQIVDLELQNLINRLQQVHYSLEVDASAKEFIVSQTSVGQYGARPIRRSIQSLIENPLSDLLLQRTDENDTHILVSSDKTTETEKLSFTFNQTNRTTEE